MVLWSGKCRVKAQFVRARASIRKAVEVYLYED